MKRLLVICLLIISPKFIYAQLDDLQKEYEDFKKGAQKEYEDFRQKANKEYAEFLKYAWASYLKKPEIPIEKVPDVPPVIFKGNLNKPQGKPVPYESVIPLPKPIVIPKPISPIPEVAPEKDKTVSFSFFGTECEVRYPKESKFHLSEVTGESLSNAWNELSGDDYNNLIRDCLDLRSKLNLCDWAYLQLLDKVTIACCGSGNDAVFLKDFIFCQSGYSDRLGCKDNKLYMLFASQHSIFKMSYFLLGGEKYYPLDCVINNMNICDKGFPNEKFLSLEVANEQLFEMGKDAPRTLVSKRYPNVRASYHSNTNLIDFYNTYPQSCINDDVTTKWQFYGNTALSESVRSTLYPELEKDIQGKSQSDAANILLNFVQTAFVYEYDDKVWGYDRPFFPDETAYYPYCDCEDRAIFFSRLVRDLMKLNVVLLYYPNHLASAVQFTENVQGDYLVLNEKKYVVCDPTYIGAPVGDTMPGMDNKTAKVVMLRMPD
jgi:hypothetical protein